MEVLVIALFYFQEILKPIIGIAVFVVIDYGNGKSAFLETVVDNAAFVQFIQTNSVLLFNIK